ncbi:fringe glycosyltransferase isoform X2 [Chelonus insularis]|uniref:fringe glycosyltransferase isoform X2 n=1 Tax=Chelonus insularis TaxID=460826 RepID=UPI00158EB4EE|nr:fringe glycosyltransferase isoform X2 [Chelonus insularis]
MLRSLSTRRGIRILVLILATAYATVLIYQAVSAPRQWPADSVMTMELSNNMENTNSLEEEEEEEESEELDKNKIKVFEVQKAIKEKISISSSVITATAISFSTDLDDLFISVKTTRHYHHSRLPAIIITWFQSAKNQTWFFTDKDDQYFQNLTNGHMINTKCSSSHSRRALCCKMSVEFDRFLDSGKKWFCHFDDDNYVNVPRLIKLLNNYNPRDDWYLGRPSIPAPLEIMKQYDTSSFKRSQKVKFWFATGGAGFCISRALALKMIPIAGGGKFISVGDRIRLPDDVTMGYIIEHLLKKKLTVVELFHSHLEPMKFLNEDTFHDQVSFSYAKGPKDEWNIVTVNGFDAKNDPNRFRSIHCRLFPRADYCSLR